MNQTSKKLLLTIITIILIIAFTPIFGNLYESYFGPVTSGLFIGPSHPEYIDGFLMSYIVFVTILLVILLNYKKYIWLLLATWPIVISLMAGDGSALIIDIFLFIIAFVLAQIILFLYKKFKK